MNNIFPFGKRIVTLYGTFFCCIIFLCFRFFYLQIVCGSYFYIKSQKNFLRIEKIKPPRGTIYDVNGRYLATNHPYIQLVWLGSGNRKLTQQQLATLATLEKILGKPLLDNKELFTTLLKQERHQKEMMLVDHISFEQLSQVLEQCAESNNIILQHHYERFYPYKTAAAHVIGHLKNWLDPEQSGAAGLEKIAESSLTGIGGRLVKTINAAGRMIDSLELEPASAGTDIITTIDIDLQLIAEELFPSHWSGAFILMDPTDGSIKVLVSRPVFDPTIFTRPIDTTLWQDMQDGLPFLNRAFNTAYPPGSIFKLITASTALSEGIITPETQINCSGSFTFAGQTYACNRRSGHGSLTCMEALAQSCNPFFFEIGSIIDIDILREYALRFGLGTKTGIILSEHEGLVPSRDWKWNIKNEAWWKGETISVAIGQSFLLATPIQIARAIGAIFTGYLVRPRIMVHESIDVQPLSISPAIRTLLQKSMNLAVQQGTGRTIKSLHDFELYVKTSTAQTSSLAKRSLGPQFFEHGWFVTYFQYKQHTPLVCVILVENIGSSRSAGSIAKNFLMRYKHHVDNHCKFNKKERNNEKTISIIATDI